MWWGFEFLLLHFLVWDGILKKVLQMVVVVCINNWTFWRQGIAILWLCWLKLISYETLLKFLKLMVSFVSGGICCIASNKRVLLLASSHDLDKRLTTILSPLISRSKFGENSCWLILFLVFFTLYLIYVAPIDCFNHSCSLSGRGHWTKRTTNGTCLNFCLIQNAPRILARQLIN
jgi:hypothetical protein